MRCVERAEYRASECRWRVAVERPSLYAGRRRARGASQCHTEAAGDNHFGRVGCGQLSTEIRRAHPELIVLTGNIADPAVLQIVRDQLWEGTAVIGLADVADPHLIERFRAIGFVDVYTKPVVAEDLVRRREARARASEAGRSRQAWWVSRMRYAKFSCVSSRWRLCRARC